MEDLPTFTGFTVNGAATVNVLPSAALTFTGSGFSTGATLQGRNSAGTANATLPTTASATAGTTTYYAAATKTINGVTNYSAVRSVSVVVVSAPTVATVTVAPSTALSFAGSGFSSGATLQGRNSTGTANATLPTTASATAGTTTYYASAAKTINGVTNYSAVRSVSVVVNALPAEECLYSASNKITSYVYGNSTITTPAAAISIKESAYDILWNGTYIYIDDYANVQLPYVSGGYKYTAGSLQKNPYYCWLGDEDGTCFEAQVCRTKI